MCCVVLLVGVGNPTCCWGVGGWVGGQGKYEAYALEVRLHVSPAAPRSNVRHHQADFEPSQLFCIVLMGKGEGEGGGGGERG